MICSWCSTRRWNLSVLIPMQWYHIGSSSFLLITIHHQFPHYFILPDSFLLHFGPITTSFIECNWPILSQCSFSIPPENVILRILYFTEINFEDLQKCMRNHNNNHLDENSWCWCSWTSFDKIYILFSRIIFCNFIAIFSIFIHGILF